jgi:hypothetical protein
MVAFVCGLSSMFGMLQVLVRAIVHHQSPSIRAAEPDVPEVLYTGVLHALQWRSIAKSHSRVLSQAELLAGNCDQGCDAADYYTAIQRLGQVCLNLQVAFAIALGGQVFRGNMVKVTQDLSDRRSSRV